MALLLLGLVAAPSRADHLDVIDCYADMGDPVPETQEWDLADTNMRWCATERFRTMIVGNPAFHAANAMNAARGTPPNLFDPFREVTTRWAGVRGRYEEVRWTDHNGATHRSVLLSPLEGDGPWPGVVFACHGCIAAQNGLADASHAGHAQTIGGGTFWVAEVFAEHGYVAFYADLGPRDRQGAIDLMDAATDFFVSTPENPSEHGEVNPWHDRLDRTLLGITGHSGGGSLAIDVGHLDDRYDAVVSFDRSGAALADRGMEFRVPTMFQVADYDGADGFLYPNRRRPQAAPGSKRTDFEFFRDLGIDTMQVTPRTSTHLDWAGAISVSPGASLYGEQVVAYYMLAWFDKYLRGATDPTVAADALSRLIATDTFDDSSDRHSIGTGYFNAREAQQANDVEAGNVPLTLKERGIRNHLSWWYPTRFWLDGGAYSCEDVRAGCPGS